MSFKELEQLHVLYKLKYVSRETEVGNRKETDAEHIYSLMMLLEFFKSKITQKVDFDRVAKLLLYHDLVEIHAGDTYFDDDTKLDDKQKREKEAFELLMQQIPDSLRTDFSESFHEYEDGLSIESKFALALDKLDPFIQSAIDPTIYSRYTQSSKQIRSRKEKYFEEFPAIKEFFENTVNDLVERKYLI